MIYSDEELKRWWDGLGKVGQRLLFCQIDQEATNSAFLDWAYDVETRWKNGQHPSPSELKSLRKWDR